MGQSLAFSVEGKDMDQPLSFYDITGVTLSSDYVNLAKGKGFFFKGDTAGAYTAITLTQYFLAGGSSNDDDTARDAIITAIESAGDTVDMLVAAYQWSDTPIVKLESTSAPSTAINIGHY
jgi:hypothetical protein